MDYKAECEKIYYASDVVNKELSFGCVVELYNGIGKDIINREYPILNDKITDGPYYICVSDRKVNRRVIKTIIGHPPTGFDWLRLILKGSEWPIHEHYTKNQFGFEYECKGISFNLTAGEPTDWEALYNVIS